MISIGPIPAFLMVSELLKYVIQVPILLLMHNKSRNNFSQSFQAKITKTKLILTTHSIVYPCNDIGTCTFKYNKQQYLVLEVSVKSGIRLQP